MVKSINIHKIYYKPDLINTDDILVNFSIFELDSLNVLGVLENETKTLTALLSDLENQDIVCDNFVIADQMPTQVPNTLEMEYLETPSLPEQQLGEYSFDLLTLFHLLAKEGAHFRFKPSMYKDLTGNYSFEDFTPSSLSDLMVPFGNMIISNKKFNVVFATVISGTVSSDHSNTEVVRYFPFKLIKGGKPLEESVEVILSKPVTNKLLLELLTRNSEKLSDLNYDLDLSKLPTISVNKPFTINTGYYLRSLVEENRVKAKALKYLIDEVKVYLQFNGELNPASDWYRGDEVIIDSLSDEGQPQLEMWITGKKSSPTVNSLKTALGSVSSAFFNQFTKMVTTETDLETSTAVAEQMKELVIEFKNKSWINQDDLILLNTLLDCMKLSGTPKEKYYSLRKVLYDLNQEMIGLEIKFLRYRNSLLERCPANNTMANDFLFSSLGEVVKASQGSVTIFSNVFQDKLTVKRTVVGGVKSTPSNELLDTLEDSLEQTNNISTNFRDKD